MDLDIVDSIERMEAEAEGRPCDLPHHCRIALEDACIYARENGLTCEYEIDPVPLIEETTRELLTDPSDGIDGIADSSHLCNFEIPSAVNISESWSVTEEAIKIIDSACRRLGADELQVLESEVTGLGRFKGLKIELPLLQSDPKQDLQELQSSVSAARQALLNDHGLPLEPVDVEMDEGLEFPSSQKRMANDMMNLVKKETIDVSRETLVNLSTYLRSDWTEEKRYCYLAEEISSYKKNPGTVPLTPPLSPAFQEEGDFVPDGDVCEVPIPSDPSSMLSADLRDAKNALFDLQDDANIFNSDNLINSPSELFSDDSTVLGFISDNLPDRSPLLDLRVEVPLRPEFEKAGEDRGDPMEWKVQDSESSETLLAHACLVDDTTSDKQLQDNMEEDPDDPFNDVLKEAGAMVKMKTEQEKLDPLDSASRVVVPIIDLSITEPHWAGIGNDSSSMFSALYDSYSSLFDVPIWPRDIERERRLIWAPVKRVEGVNDTWDEVHDHAVQEMLDQQISIEVPTSANYVWKHPGWAILREDDCDDEEDLIAPVGRKRLFGNNVDKGAADRIMKGQEEQKEDCKNADNIGRSLLDEDLPAATRLLDNYLDLHAPERFRKSTSTGCSQVPPNPVYPQRQVQVIQKDMTQDTAALASVGAIAYFPTVQPPDEPPRVIISLSLSRAIIRHLETLLPGIEMVDRDYDAYNTSQWIPGSTCRSEIVSPLAAEADITVSPETGILLTTMVKIRQKPIPGTNELSIQRNRTERISARYERLILLVSEGSRDEEAKDLASTDVAALADFQGFLASLDSTATMYYVAGGEETLAKWVAWCICQHEAEGLRTRRCIVEVESLWEVMLRRAGLNVYASQAIIAALKAPGEEPSEDSIALHGLSAFTSMDPRERAARFESMMGGVKVLERVSRNLDAKWQ